MDLSAHPSAAGCLPGSRQETPGSGRPGPAPQPASGQKLQTLPSRTRDFVSLFLVCLICSEKKKTNL